MSRGPAAVPSQPAAALLRPMGLAVLVACVLATGACRNNDAAGRAAHREPAPSAGNHPGTASGAGADSATVGGDGSPIELQPLEQADLDAMGLDGELACAFVAGGETLLLARGNAASDEPARGRVRIAGHPQPVAAPGGFDGMLRGARFQGAGTVIVVGLEGPPVGRGESPPAPASLVFHRADGARRDVSGQWRCGP